jgi:hypothetical protein
MAKFDFMYELKRQSLSLVGAVISAGAYVYAKFVPTNIPVPVSQSIIPRVGVAGGYASVEPVIALSTVAIILFSVFLIVAVVRIARKK